jgi:O-antigen/teichoic acid export membrane protein
MTMPQSAPRRGRMVRNVIYLALGQVGTTLLTVLLNGTLARTFAPADFGVLYLASTIANFVYVFVDWGHGGIIIRDTARHPERAGNLLGSALAVRTVFALTGCVIALGTTWALGYNVYTCMLTVVLILALLPQYLGLSFGWVFRGHERMERDAILNVVLKLATLVASIGCIVLGGSLMGVVFAWSLAGCLTLATAIVMYRRMHLPTISATMSTARALVRDGAPLLAMSLAVAVEPFINANLLFKMVPAAVVGWYGAASNISGTLIAPATILGATMYPRLSIAAGDPVEFKRTFEISFRPLLLLAVLGAVGTYLFADVAVGLIFTMEKFGPAADTLRAYVPMLLLIYVDVFLGNAIFAAGKAGPLAFAKIAAVAVATIFVFILVPVCQSHFGNGGIGVMYAMAIGELPMLIAAGILLKGVIDRRTLVDVGRCLIAGVVTILLLRWLPPITPFLGIPLCVLVFGGVAFLFGAAKKSDAEMVLASFRKRSPASA